MSARSWPGQRELDVGAGPLEGIHHRALGLELGGAEGDVEVQRIGLLGVAQHDERAAHELQVSGWPSSCP